MTIVEVLAVEMEELFEELIAHQRQRVLERARRLNPRITGDDVLSPIDMPELAADAEWNYEDGLLAGYLAAQMAVRAHLLRRG
jgi:hypothetical protein